MAEPFQTAAMLREKYMGVDPASGPDRTALAWYKHGELVHLWFDEESTITPAMIRAVRRLGRDRERRERKQRAKGGWFNWYLNRGRLSFAATPSELRRLSWRRAF